MLEGIRQIDAVGVPRRKVVIATGWYAADFSCNRTVAESSQPQAHPLEPAELCAVNFSDSWCASPTGRSPGYGQVLQLLHKSGGAARQWDSDFQVPYFDVAGDQSATVCDECRHKDRGCSFPNTCPYVVDGDPSTSKARVHRIYYDDPASLAVKYEAILAAGLRGVGMWTAEAPLLAMGPKVAAEMWAVVPPRASPARAPISVAPHRPLQLEGLAALKADDSAPVSRAVGGGWQLTFSPPVLVSGEIDTSVCNYSTDVGRCLGPVRMLSNSIAIPCDCYALDANAHGIFCGEQYYQHYAPVNQTVPATLNMSVSFALSTDSGATWQSSKSLSNKPASGGGSPPYIPLPTAGVVQPAGRPDVVRAISTSPLCACSGQSCNDSSGLSFGSAMNCHLPGDPK